MSMSLSLLSSDYCFSESEISAISLKCSDYFGATISASLKGFESTGPRDGNFRLRTGSSNFSGSAGCLLGSCEGKAASSASGIGPSTDFSWTSIESARS